MYPVHPAHQASCPVLPLEFTVLSAGRAVSQPTSVPNSLVSLFFLTVTCLTAVEQRRSAGSLWATLPDLTIL